MRPDSLTFSSPLRYHPSRRAPTIRFKDELEDAMPEEEAERTLHTVINWARYAEVLAFDGESGMVSLDIPS